MDPLQRPIPRRRALQIVGGVVAAGAGFGSVFEACGPPPPPVWVPFDLDVESLPVETPTEVPLTATLYERTVLGSLWVIRAADDSLTVYDSRCTHAKCAYTWSDVDDRFTCLCHEGYFRKDGSVISGPPPRPLDRLPTRTAATGGLEVEVPGTFATPRPSA
jgi:Rieske Fe-S protein